MKQNFCTGSSYKGELNEYGMMHGHGVYTFPNGSIYEGNFQNGEFHGDGKITCPSNFTLYGNFVNGKCSEYKTEFSDKTPYTEKDWTYCKYPDRRYSLCKDAIPAVGNSYLTSHDAACDIPESWYDVEEGFYDPNTGYIMSKDDKKKVLRSAEFKERAWILKNCRNTMKGPVGYQQDIIDENILALQDLFDETSSECVCFTSSSDFTSVNEKTSDDLIQGYCKTSSSQSTKPSNEKIIGDFAENVANINWAETISEIEEEQSHKSTPIENSEISPRINEEE